jgi:hypothetical protein
MLGTPHQGLFPEFREMIGTAREYLAGEIHFSELNAPVMKCKAATHFFVARPELQEMAAEWELMLHRMWNEWNFLPKEEEISEEEFRTWVAKQLDVFEPFDPVAEVIARRKHEAEQVGTKQPATRSQSELEGNDKPKTEAEGRRR